MYPLAVLSHLRPRFSCILDHSGRARSRRRASVRYGESPLYILQFVREQRLEWRQSLSRNTIQSNPTRSTLIQFNRIQSDQLQCNPTQLDPVRSKYNRIQSSPIQSKTIEYWYNWIQSKPIQSNQIQSTKILSSCLSVDDLVLTTALY